MQIVSPTSKMNSTANGSSIGVSGGDKINGHLLFLDTFSHDAAGNQINLDLVQFPSPVIVEEVRVIPLGAKVPFLGGVRLGATNPTVFKLDFFVNDLSKPGAATFESLGTLQYNQSQQIQLLTTKFIPTDGLVLKGSYSTITLAVYGSLSQSTAEELAIQATNAAKNPPPKESVEIHDKKEVEIQQPKEVEKKRPHTPERTLIQNNTEDSVNGCENEITKQKNSSPTNRSKTPTSPPPKPLSQPSSSPFLGSPLSGSDHRSSTPRDLNESKEITKDIQPKDDFLDAISDISDGDISDVIDDENMEETPSEPPKKDTPKLVSKSPSPIKDQQNDDNDSLMEEISDDDAHWSDEGANDSFSQNFDNEFLDDYEEYFKYFDIKSSVIPEALDIPQTPLESSKVIDSIEYLSNNLCSSEWIGRLEQATQILDSEPNLILIDNEQELLWKCCSKALDFNLAINQEAPTDKVKHIKSGLKFVKSVVFVSNKVLIRLIKGGLQAHLLNMISDKVMAHSIKEIAIQILDLSICNNLGFQIFSGQKKVETTEAFLKTKSEDISLYAHFLNLLQTSSVRLKQSASILCFRSHFHELCHNLLKQTHCLSESDIHSEKTNEILINICDTIVAITSSFKEAQSFMLHPIKMMKNSFKKYDPTEDIYTGIFKVFNSTLLMDNLYLITTHPLVGKINLVEKICDLLSLICFERHGGKFLCSNEYVCTPIMKTLSNHSTLCKDEKVNDLQDLIILTTNAYAYLHEIETIKDTNEFTYLDVVPFQYLYGILYSTTHRQTVAQLIAFSHEILLKYVKCESKEETEQSKNSQKFKLAIQNYATEMMTFIFKNCESLISLRPSFQDITHVVENLEIDNELNSWTSPLLVNTDLIKLCDNAKKHSDNIESLPAELLTSTTLILDCCTEESSVQKEAIISIHTNGIIETYIKILTKVSEMHSQPTLHTATFAGSYGLSLLRLVKTIVKTMRIVLKYAIESRVNDYKDTSFITSMIITYNICESILPKSICFKISQTIKKEIYALLSYLTLPALNLKVSEEVLDGNCWTLMLSEILEFILKLPHYSSPGLNLLSNLLPLTLPMDNIELSEDQKDALVKSRKLWSAHIVQSEMMLRNVISKLIEINDSNLRYYLGKTLIKIADLSEHTSSIVGNEITKSLKHSIKVENNSKSDAILKFIASVIQAPCMKINLLKEIKCNNIEDEANYLLNIFEQMLFSEEQANNVLLIYQALCNPDIYLSESSDVLINQDLLSIINNQIIEKILDSSNSLLMENFLKLVHYQSRSSTGLSNLLSLEKKLLKSISFILNFISSKPEDYLKLLDNFVNLCFYLKKSQKISLLKPVLNSNETKIQILIENIKQEKYLVEDLKSLLDWVHNNNDVEEDQPMEVDEEDKQSMNLSKQYENRIFVVTSEQKFLLEFNEPISIQDNKESNGIKIDLINLSEEYLTKNFDLISQTQLVVEEKFLEKKETNNENTETKTALERKALETKSLISNFKAGGVSSVRNNVGFSRPNMRSDGFRSRPPNTSRPPSLHVDDFVLLQQRGQQPTGPTGYNKKSLKAAKELFAQREAEQNKGSMVGFREATKEPVYFNPQRSGSNLPPNRRQSRIMESGNKPRGPPRNRPWSPNSNNDGDDRRKFYPRGMRDKRMIKGRDDRNRHLRQPPR